MYGYHTGWDFDRIVAMFHYLKRRDLERHKDAVMAVAIGSSAIVGGKALKKFTDEVDKAIGNLRPKRKTEVLNELNKLMGMLGGGI